MVDFNTYLAETLKQNSSR